MKIIVAVNKSTCTYLVELRELLQRLAALPKENLEVTKKYADDTVLISSISGFINQENTLLSRQAAEIANKIPIEYISATEYYAIGVALQNAYNNEEAKTFYEKAIKVSDNLNDRVSALRNLATLQFMTSQPEAGRINFQEALNVFSDFGNNQFNDYTKISTHIWTELSWSLAEAGIGSKEFPLQRIENAETLLSKLDPSPEKYSLKLQIDQARKRINGESNLKVPPSESQIAP
jgi:tetratricopeptide (TPR) repeat protein